MRGRGPARLRVALTFDAEHPDRATRPDAARNVVDELEREGVAGTFFLQGRWVQAEPRLASRIAAEGHLIGSHSFYHARMHLFSADGFATDLAAAEWAIRQYTGVSPRPWFRLPFGSGATRPEVIRQLAQAGYRHIGWHVEPKEWRVRQSPQRVAAAIVDGALAHGDGAIVLLHTWPAPVAGALRQAIPDLRRRGAEFVRLDQLDLPPGLEPVGEPRPAEPVWPE